MRHYAVAVFCTLAVSLHAASVSETLQKQTQELMDAITFGKADVWDRYLDARATVTAEDGSVTAKPEMVKSIRPLPANVSGTIRVIDFKAYDHGSVAVTNYVADEDENYHGHALHCQYRSTDTWIKTPQGWRLIASQVLALRTDPPAMNVSDAQTDAYIGTYSLSKDVTYEIRRNEGKLEGRQSGRDWEPILVEAPDVLFVPGKPRYRKVFQRDAGGRITGFAERREAWDLSWTRLPQ